MVHNFSWVLPYSDKKQGGYKAILNSPELFERAKQEYEENRTSGISESKWHCDLGRAHCPDCNRTVSFLSSLKKRLAALGGQAVEQPPKRTKQAESAYVENKQVQSFVMGADGSRKMIL